MKQQEIRAPVLSYEITRTKLHQATRRILFCPYLMKRWVIPVEKMKKNPVWTLRKVKIREKS